MFNAYTKITTKSRSIISTDNAIRIQHGNNFKNNSIVTKIKMKLLTFLLISLLLLNFLKDNLVIPFS